MARLQHQIAQAERQAGQGRPKAGSARYPLAPDQIALSHYMQRLAFDDELRNDPRYASILVDDMQVVCGSACKIDPSYGVIGVQK